jgi:hypothetical protein
MHLSLLFKPRITGEGAKPKDTLEEQMDLFNQHILLCEKVLQNNFLGFIRNNSVFMTSETWTVLLKVLLGVCDTLLDTKLQRPVAAVKPGFDFNDLSQITFLMGDKLCETLIKVSEKLT